MFSVILGNAVEPLGSRPSTENVLLIPLGCGSMTMGNAVEPLGSMKPHSRGHWKFPVQCNNFNGTSRWNRFAYPAMRVSIQIFAYVNLYRFRGRNRITVKITPIGNTCRNLDESHIKSIRCFNSHNII